MMISIKMLNDVAQNAALMADAAQKMAAAMQAIVDDCADQLAMKKAVEASAAPTEAPSAPTEAPSAPAEVPSETPEAPVTSTEASAPALTIVELRARVSELSTPENRPKIRSVLTKYGAKKLTDIDPAQYQEFKTEVENACRV